MFECFFFLFSCFFPCLCAHNQIRPRFRATAHFLLAVGSRMKLLRGAEMMETVQKGGDNLRTGSFGIVHLDCHAMSRHLNSSFTATSHTDSLLMRQIHTSHLTRCLFVTRQSQRGRWMGFRSTLILCTGG